MAEEAPHPPAPEIQIQTDPDGTVKKIHSNGFTEVSIPYFVDDAGNPVGKPRLTDEEPVADEEQQRRFRSGRPRSLFPSETTPESKEE